MPTEAQTVTEFFAIIDRFNAMFGERGWVAFALLDYPVLVRALELAEKGDIDAGEAMLVDHFSAETVDFYLGQMAQIAAFRPRERLARLALDDYRAERYHACIPVTLALLDGLVNDLCLVNDDARKGFFAIEPRALKVGAIAGRPGGLADLALLLVGSKSKTEDRPITMPYRNGILHGIYLRYDNQMVAAKAWATLFALYEWARQTENAQLGITEPQIDPFELNVTLAGKLVALRQHATMQDWQPRKVTVGVDVPVTGLPGDYPSDTPEQAAVAFLHWWKMGNWGYVADRVPQIPGEKPGAMPALVRDGLQPWPLDDFALREIRDLTPDHTQITVTLNYVINQNIEKPLDLYRANDCSWRVVNWREVMA